MRKILTCVTGALIAIAANAQMDGDPVMRLVMPYGAGGDPDLIAHLIEPKLSFKQEQSVLVENCPSAATRVGTQEIEKTNADSQTLLIVDTALTTNSSQYWKMANGSAKNFAPASLLATAPVILAAHQSVPANNLKELITLGKKQSLPSVSGRSEGAAHLGSKLLAFLVGIKLKQTSYKGAGPAVNAPGLSVRMSELGFIAIGGWADEYRTNIQREASRWQAVPSPSRRG